MKTAAIRHTICEKDFVLKSIKNGIRLDGRQSFDYRNIEIKFGVDYGCCEVQLGNTRAIAQTSSEIAKPIETRPTEGQLFLNLDLSPLASPAYECGRVSDYGVEVNRMIERCLKESRPIDVESLCIVAGEKVWNIRVDILLMNDNGNILDCCCIAAIASLSHFKRPDITITGDDILIHPMEEKEPVPLNVHHMPICTTFGFVGNGEHIIVDPEEKEESIIAGQLIMTFNVFGEICCTQMSGGVTLEYEQIMQCAKIASIKAVEINDLIKEGLEEDRIRRAPAPTVRREGLKDPPKITKTTAEPTEVDTTTIELERNDEPMSANLEEVQPVQHLGEGIAAIGKGGTTSWVMSDDDSDDDLDNGGLYVPCYIPTPLTNDSSYTPTPISKDKGYTPTPISKDEGYTPTPISRVEGYTPTPMSNDEGYTPTPMTNNAGYTPGPMTKDAGYTPGPLKENSRCNNNTISDDSEEEGMAVLNPDELDMKNRLTEDIPEAASTDDTSQNDTSPKKNENLSKEVKQQNPKKKKKKKKKAGNRKK